MESDSTLSPMLLSEELEGSLNKYGLSNPELLLPSRSKKKAKDPVKSMKLSNDIVEAVKKLSKREKKREEQIAVSIALHVSVVDGFALLFIGVCIATLNE